MLQKALKYYYPIICLGIGIVSQSTYQSINRRVYGLNDKYLSQSDWIVNKYWHKVTNWYYKVLTSIKFYYLKFTIIYNLKQVLAVV